MLRVLLEVTGDYVRSHPCNMFIALEIIELNIAKMNTAAITGTHNTKKIPKTMANDAVPNLSIMLLFKNRPLWKQRRVFSP